MAATIGSGLCLLYKWKQFKEAELAQLVQNHEDLTRIGSQPPCQAVREAPLEGEECYLNLNSLCLFKHLETGQFHRADRWVVCRVGGPHTWANTTPLIDKATPGTCPWPQLSSRLCGLMGDFIKQTWIAATGAWGNFHSTSELHLTHHCPLQEGWKKNGLNYLSDLKAHIKALSSIFYPCSSSYDIK